MTIDVLSSLRYDALTEAERDVLRSLGSKEDDAIVYTLDADDGSKRTTETLRDAMDAIEARYPDMYAMHEVGQRDVSCSDETIDGGDNYRILVWETEAESFDDDGARAVASIRHVD